MVLYDHEITDNILFYRNDNHYIFFPDSTQDEVHPWKNYNIWDLIAYLITY